MLDFVRHHPSDIAKVLRIQVLVGEFMDPLAELGDTFGTDKRLCISIPMNKDAFFFVKLSFVSDCSPRVSSISQMKYKYELPIKESIQKMVQELSLLMHTRGPPLTSLLLQHPDFVHVFHNLTQSRLDTESHEGRRVSKGTKGRGGHGAEPLVERVNEPALVPQKESLGLGADQDFGPELASRFLEFQVGPPSFLWEQRVPLLNVL